MVLLNIRRLEEMLKWAKPWIGLLNATLTRDLVQVHPAAGTEPTTLRPAKGLNRQV